LTSIRRRDFLRYGAMGLVAAVLPPADRGVRAGAPAGTGAIVSCVIHPAIGIARVGNSPDRYFLGPEVPGPYPVPDGGFKDATGRLKRQAARFRIFGLDSDGNVVQEVTAADADITWTAHLANKKASWYKFDLAFDIPEASGGPPSPGVPAGPPLQSARRNAGFTGPDRARLIIDPGAVTIAGAGVNTDGGESQYSLGGGRFNGRAVPLGELRTDEAGRLLVLGGSGTSGTLQPNAPATEFANNEGWNDDTSDGPIEASVRIGDTVMQATGAWAVVGPPDFAPGIRGIVTMFDLLFEVATKLEPDLAPPRPSFTRQIYPLLERHVQTQWVNEGFAKLFGWGAAGDFLTPATLATLADPSPQSQAARQAVFSSFRDPAFPTMQPAALPPLYGDNTNFPAQSARQWMAVLELQYRWLRQWAAGDFDADWPSGGLIYPSALEDLPIDEQPAALDRAALDECTGGPFHPGCEMTWPMRVLSLYAAPFRLKRRSGTEPDWGDIMTSMTALSSNGPLSASAAGDLTRWMAVPWQTDTSSCLSAYEPEIDQFLPSFWPARVPNDVLTMDRYQKILDSAAAEGDKQAAFATRLKWLRGLPPDDVSRINAFVTLWSELGVISRQAGPPNDSSFPDTFWVETGRSASLQAAEGRIPAT